MIKVSRVSRISQKMSKVSESWVSRVSKAFQRMSRVSKGVKLFSAFFFFRNRHMVFLPPLPSTSHFDVFFFFSEIVLWFFSYFFLRLRLKARRTKEIMEEGAPRPIYPWGAWGSGHSPTVKRAASGCPPMAPAS